MGCRLSMFKWKIHCAWCEIKSAFSFLVSGEEVALYPNLDFDQLRERPMPRKEFSLSPVAWGLLNRLDGTNAYQCSPGEYISAAALERRGLARTWANRDGSFAAITAAGHDALEDN
jgi:hypothetical protein